MTEPLELIDCLSPRMELLKLTFILLLYSGSIGEYRTEPVGPPCLPNSPHLKISSQLYTNFKRGSKLTNKGVNFDKERVKNDSSIVNFDPW